MQRRLIGLDLDNTIIDYEQAFAPVAEEIGLIPKGAGLASKRRGQGSTARCRRRRRLDAPSGSDLRPLHRARHPLSWLERLHFRRRFPRRQGGDRQPQDPTWSLPTPPRIDLREAALGWLDRRGFFNSGGFDLDRGDVYFEETRSGKLARIAEVGCDVFIDDLPEVFHAPGFPQAVEKLWFAGNRPEAEGGGLKAYRNWRQLLDMVLAMT